MSIGPEPTEPRPEDELGVVSDVFGNIDREWADPGAPGIDSSASEPGAAMFYTQGGSPC